MNTSVLHALPGLSPRHPLRNRAVLVALAAEAVLLLLAFGFAPEAVETFELVFGSLLNVAVLLGLVVAAEPAVTPVSDPRAHGEALLPASNVEELLDELGRLQLELNRARAGHVEPATPEDPPRDWPVDPFPEPL